MVASGSCLAVCMVCSLFKQFLTLNLVESTQLAFTCSKSTIVHDVVLVFLLLTLNVFHTFF